MQTSGEVTLGGGLYLPPVEFVDGDVVTYTVTALDPWGEGPGSAPVTLTFAASDEPVDTGTTKPAPEPDRGCSSTGSPPSVILALGALVILRARRAS